MKKNVLGQLKEIGADKLVLLLLAGILLMLSFGGEAGTNDEKIKEENITAGIKVEDDYDAELEKRLMEIFEKAYGVGNVCVMVTMEESENKVLATVNGECIFDGDSPYVIKNEAPKIRGVVVIVKSGNLPRAALEITEACEVLLGISSNRVKVISKN